MKNVRLLWAIVKRCHLERFVIMYFVCYFIASGILCLREPEMITYRDGMWYLFVASTSIGFGDIVVTTTLGRIITSFMTMYEIVLVAMVSGVVVSHYLEVVNKTEEETATVFLDKLEHISELSKEELKEIEVRVKKFTRQR